MKFFWKETSMRLLSLIPAVVALFVSGAASAQTWAEYVNRGDFFTVNLPGEPTVQEIMYKTAKGTTLPAHIYTTQDSRGIYRLTVVDYSSAIAEAPSAIDEAVNNIRAKGTPKYEGVNMLDMHRSWRITVETPASRRILGEILVSDAKRLYISEAETSLTAPPDGPFAHRATKVVGPWAAAARRSPPRWRSASLSTGPRRDHRSIERSSASSRCSVRMVGGHALPSCGSRFRRSCFPSGMSDGGLSGSAEGPTSWTSTACSRRRRAWQRWHGPGIDHAPARRPDSGGQPDRDQAPQHPIRLAGFAAHR